jgi:LysM repeat protein
MVALVAYPLLFSGHSSGPPVLGSPGPFGSGASSGPAASSTAVASPSASFTFQKYLVQPGDWLAKIAIKYNLQVWELLDANPSLQGNPSYIQADTYLNIPPAGYYGTQPPVTPSPSA